MSFFNSGLFWFLQGILATLITIGFKTWMEDRGVILTWWKWTLWGVWMLFVAFTIAFVFTSIGEGERVAAVKGGILFTLIVIVFGTGLWRVLHRPVKDAPSTKSEPGAEKGKSPETKAAANE